MSLAAAAARVEVSEAELEEWLKQKQAKEFEAMHERSVQPRWRNAARDLRWIASGPKAEASTITMSVIEK